MSRKTIIRKEKKEKGKKKKGLIKLAIKLGSRSFAVKVSCD
jgi:DNA-binding XRE family transcriptional regulator